MSRLIDADAFKEYITSACEDMKHLFNDGGTVAKLITESFCKDIDEQPTIQPEIIYCGDGCKFWNRHAGEQAGTCDILRQCTHESFYCGNAKRKEVTE